jgi:ribosome modulation factor
MSDRDKRDHPEYYKAGVNDKWLPYTGDLLKIDAQQRAYQAGLDKRARDANWR